jgi:hypothetical protein
MAQLPRLAEFEHQYLQEGVGRSSVSHSGQNDVAQFVRPIFHSVFFECIFLMDCRQLKKYERESMISIISDFDSVYQIRRKLG